MSKPCCARFGARTHESRNAGPARDRQPGLPTEAMIAAVLVAKYGWLAHEELTELARLAEIIDLGGDIALE
jgi:hypothetical protein